jgi:uncharacterized protein (DUF305 family)
MKAITPLAALAALAATSVLAQQPQMSMSGQTAVNLPEACRTAGQAGGHADMMQKMHSSMSQSMQSMPGMMAQMTETQKGLMNMNGPMMTGMMAKDADVAWVCAMIPHHQGAIDMARAGLKGADNAESKKLAEETIQSQEKEIAKLVAWVEKNAARESKNEAGGSKPQQ